MLEFLRKIFQNEEQEVKKITEVKLQDLENWVNESSKPIMGDIKQQIEEILMKADEETQKTRFNVEVLENAKLQNSNIPFKAKQYMEGNRKAYTRAINSFVGHIGINNKDYFYLLDFCKKFDELIIQLNQTTIRSYTILQEFFSNEAGKIAQNLKNFDNIFAELKSVLNNKKIVAVNKAREKIQTLKTKTKQKINLDVDFKNIEAAIMLAKEEKNAIMIDIEKFNDGDESNNFVKLNSEKKTKATAFYNDENRLLQSFSVLERALRKYSHVAFEHEEIVLDYLKQPIKTLLNDKFFKILEILKNLEKLLNENKLQIDDKKREKSLEEIKKLDKEFLEQFLKKYISFKAEIEEIENKIKFSGVTEKLKNFNRQLGEINLKIEKNNAEFERLENGIIKLTNSADNLKIEVEGEIKKIFGDGVKILI